MSCRSTRAHTRASMHVFTAGERSEPGTQHLPHQRGVCYRCVPAFRPLCSPQFSALGARPTLEGPVWFKTVVGRLFPSVQSNTTPAAAQKDTPRYATELGLRIFIISSWRPVVEPTLWIIFSVITMLLLHLFSNNVREERLFYSKNSSSNTASY